MRLDDRNSQRRPLVDLAVPANVIRPLPAVVRVPIGKLGVDYEQATERLFPVLSALEAVHRFDQYAIIVREAVALFGSPSAFGQLAHPAGAILTQRQHALFVFLLFGLIHRALLQEDSIVSEGIRGVRRPIMQRLA